MFTYAFEILKAHLLANITELRELDFYLQQDSTTDKNTWLYAAPALFIEFSLTGDLRTHGGKIQSAPVDISIHLLTENVFDSAKRMKKDQPKDHMILFDRVNKAMHGFSAKLSYLTEFVALQGTPNDQRVFNSLSRSGITPPHSIRKSMMKSIQVFSCIMYDHGAINTYTKIVGGELTVNAEISMGNSDTFDETFDQTFD